MNFHMNLWPHKHNLNLIKNEAKMKLLLYFFILVIITLYFKEHYIDSKTIYTFNVLLQNTII